MQYVVGVIDAVQVDPAVYVAVRTHAEREKEMIR